MDKGTVEKFQNENRPVWFLGIWSAMPIEGKIAGICEDDSTGGGYAKVNFVRDDECRAFGSADVCIDDIFESKDSLVAAMFEDMQKKTAEIEAAIQTKDDCIQFMFSHTVSGAAEYTDWTARRAIQKIAKKRWGLELK